MSKLVILSLLTVLALPAHAYVSVVVLVQSKDQKPYEVHVISNNMKNTPQARRLIREACQESAPNYSVEEFMKNRDLMKDAIKAKLATKDLAGNIALFRMYRDKEGIKAIK